MEFYLEKVDKATKKFTKVIGEGAFETVYLGENTRSSGSSVAMKCG